VVRCPDATDDKTAAEFASLVPPAEQCDEPLPPYKIIKPVYDGQFTDTFPQIDSVRPDTVFFSYFNSSHYQLLRDITTCPHNTRILI